MSNSINAHITSEEKGEGGEGVMPLHKQGSQPAFNGKKEEESEAAAAVPFTSP